MTSRIALVSAGLATALVGSLAALPGTTAATAAAPSVTEPNACATTVPDPASTAPPNTC